MLLINKELKIVFIFLFIFLLKDSLFALNNKKNNYCKNYYQNNYFTIFNNYLSESNFYSLSTYPFLGDLILKKIESYNSQLDDLEKIKDIRKFKKKSNKLYKELRNLLFNIVLIDNIDIYKQYFLLNKKTVKIIHKQIMPEIFQNYFILNYPIEKVKKIINEEDLFLFKVKKNQNNLNGTVISKKQRKIISFFSIEIFYMAKILNKQFFKTFLDNNPWLMSKFFNKRIKNSLISKSKRFCFNKKRFQELKNKLLNNKKLTKIFIYYTLMNDNKLIYYYLFSHKFNNKLLFFINNKYKLLNKSKKTKEDAIKNLILLFKYDKNIRDDKYLSLDLLKNIYYFNNSIKINLENSYIVWFYTYESLKLIKKHKDYILSNKKYRNILLSVLKQLERSAYLLKSYFIEKNTNNVVKINNDLREILDIYDF